MTSKQLWYGHAKFQSKVDVYYCPTSDIWTWNKRFDSVVSGAIIEHPSDSVLLIGDLARLANEKSLSNLLTLPIPMTPS